MNSSKKIKVLVTGASRGIGKAIAEKLLTQGYDVIGTCRNPSSEKASSIQLLQLDLSNKASIETCSKQAGEIDVLINNAGISQMGAVEELPMEKIRELFETNFFGMIEITKAFLPQMRQRRNGFIINIGSLAGKFAVPFSSSYVASKFALAGFSWSLRNEVIQFGIKVTTIEPGDIFTTIEPELFTQVGSEYEQNLKNAKQARDASMKKSPGAEVVASKVWAILKKYLHGDKQPEPFYEVGKNASLLVTAKRFLPNSVVEKGIRKSYGLEDLG